jgi:NifU-like protein involved in Fe-S cluster formation
MTYLTQTTDKYNLHNYYQTYKQLSKTINVNKLLEIGVGGYQSSHLGGDSLFSWAELFPVAKLVALDYYDKSLIEKPLNSEIYLGSQDDPEILQKMVDEQGTFDIIIDDGSHISRHIIYSFEFLFPHLSDDGVYVIEDTQTSYWKKFEGDLDSPNTSMNYFKALLDSINAKEISVEHPQFLAHPFASQIKSICFEHNLILITKGTNTYPSNFNFDIENYEVKNKIQEIKHFCLSNPYSATATTSLATLLFQGKEYENTLQVCSDFLEVKQTNFRIQLLKAKSLKALNHIEQLVDFLYKCLNQFPNEILFLKLLQPALPLSSQGPCLKDIAYHINASEEDLVSYFQYLANNKCWEDLQQGLNQLNLSSHNFELFDFFKAIIIDDSSLAELEIAKAHNSKPNNLPILLVYFRLLNRNKKYNTFISVFNKLNVSLQKSRVISILYINTLIANKSFDEAESIIYQRLELDNTYHFWDLLSKCKEEKGEINQAAAFAFQALNCNPNHKSLQIKFEKFRQLITL